MRVGVDVDIAQVVAGPEDRVDEQPPEDESVEPSFNDFGAQDPKSAQLSAAGDLLSGLARDKKLNLPALENVVVPVFNGLKAEPIDQLAWFFPRPAKDYRALHALNACRLAMYFARESGMDDARIVHLGIVALLYDTGMWLDGMPPVLEPRAMSADEMAKIESSTTLGAALLEGVEGVDPLCARVAREHHERADGTGYPSHSPADTHHPYSRLVQLVDSFLGMIEPRPFRKAITPSEAMQRLAVQAHRGYFFAPAFRDWVRVMGMHPVGSFVTLNTGEIAVVTKSGGQHLRRPVVNIIADELLDFRPRPMEIDLAVEQAFEISGPFTNFPKA